MKPHPQTDSSTGRPRPRASAPRLFAGFAGLVLLAGPCLADHILVTSAADDNTVGTLRWAIDEANNLSGPDEIHFSGSLWGYTISLASNLPAVTDASTTIAGHVDLDGLPMVTIDGNGFRAIHLASDGNQVRDLRFVDCKPAIYVHDSNGLYGTANSIGPNNHCFDSQGHAITLLGGASTGNTVFENFVHGSSADGINVSAASNHIGPGNVVTGSNAAGILLVEGGNWITDNWVGTDPDGSAGLGNGLPGIRVQQGSDGNTIERNVCCSNRDGIQLNSSENNVIRDNTIGTDPAHRPGLGNQINGIVTFGGAGNNTIVDNVIAGNGSTGITIGDPGDSSTLVSGNTLGLPTVPSAGRGLSLHNANNTVSNNLIQFHAICGIELWKGTENNSIEDNTFLENGQAGIRTRADAGYGNRMLGNTFLSNGCTQLSIDLGGDGPTPNDWGDKDDGPNGLRNHPVLSGAVQQPHGLTLYGRWASARPKPLTVEFYESDCTGSRGVGVPFATHKVPDSVSSKLGPRTNQDMVTLTNVQLPDAHFVSAVITDADGNTSEVSPAAPVGEWSDLGHGLAGTYGVPVLAGSTLPTNEARLVLVGARANSLTLLYASLSRTDKPHLGGTMVPGTWLWFGNPAVYRTDSAGSLVADFAYPFLAVDSPIFFQCWISDPAAPQGASASNAVSTLVQRSWP